MPTYANARALIDQVIKKYRSLDSYCDIGVVRPTFAYEPLSCWFETDFTKSDRFRFQFIRPHPYRRLRNYRLTKYVAGSDGSKAYFLTQQHGYKAQVEEEENLEMAVAGATGISQGTAHTIGSLLLDCVGGFNLSMLTRLRFRQSRKFDGVMCYRISGIHPCGGKCMVWVGANDLLLRKFVCQRSKKEEVRFNIVVNAHIPETRFDVPVNET